MDGSETQKVTKSYLSAFMHISLHQSSKRLHVEQSIAYPSREATLTSVFFYLHLWFSYICLLMLILVCESLLLLFATCTCLSFQRFIYHVFVSSAFCTMYSSRYLQYSPDFSGWQVTHRVSKSEWFFLQKILYENLH